MEPEHSCSLTGARRYHVPDESNSPAVYSVLAYILVFLPTYAKVSVVSVLFFRFPTEIRYELLVPSTRATCPAHPIHFY